MFINRDNVCICEISLCAYVSIVLFCKVFIDVFRVGLRRIVDSVISTSDDVSYTVRQTEATSGGMSNSL